jgi:hypothetical protein
MNNTSYLKMDLAVAETNVERKETQADRTRQLLIRLLSGFMIALMVCPVLFWLGTVITQLIKR